MTVSQSVIYSDYLQLEKLLSCQSPVSPEKNVSAHDEMLFITIHQTYELWFKQILHELNSVISMFDDNFVDERNIGVALGRIERIVEIEKLLINQIDVLETMTPLDFLDFRHLLIGASGFQSSQFRLIENLLGLDPKERVGYSSCPYFASLKEKEREQVIQSEQNASLFSVLDQWLARTPFLDFQNYRFVDQYKAAFKVKMDREHEEVVKSQILDSDEKKSRSKSINATRDYVLSMLSENSYKKVQEQGQARFSYQAFIAAIFINLYRDQPILHMPFKLLSGILEVDEYLNLWRHRHAVMVHRMIGTKMGTGGSTGHDYLQQTTEHHRVFSDLYNLSTLLIPRSELPELPEDFQSKLGFFFSSMGS